MTEQEIIDYLKNNKNEGRIIAFMPEEVRKWCVEHRKELLVWQSHHWYEKFDADDICTDDAVTLPDDYKVKEKPKGEWVEFEIDQRGNFHCFMNGDMHYFFWANWNAFLIEAYSLGYTAFGGWKYADKGTRWYTYPMLHTKGYSDIMDAHLRGITNIKDEVIPVIPVKIRFWKEE